MKDIFNISYELNFQGKWKLIEGLANEIIINQSHIIWADYTTGQTIKHNIEKIRKLKIKN